MTELIELDSNYSTTRNVTREKAELEKKPQDKFETVLFLPEGKGRQGEGGLRTQGYFKASLEGKPLLTIVTVVYNGEQFLEETILSVINQTYDNVEYIIVDGGSTDSTLDIIHKYEHALDYWVSEKDKGISDAFNKAVICSLGEYINFQGDGDGFCKRSSLKETLLSVSLCRDEFISARIQRTTLTGESLYTSSALHSFDKNSLLWRMSLPHQGLLTPKSYFLKYGLFDVDNKFCMDYEHLLRGFNHFPNVLTSEIILANWRSDGLGNGRTLDVLKEYNQIKKQNSIASNFILNYVHLWTLLKYYIKKGLNIGKY